MIITEIQSHVPWCLMFDQRSEVYRSEKGLRIIVTCASVLVHVYKFIGIYTVNGCR